MKRFTHILFISCALFYGVSGTALAEPSKENMVKAAIIYNLARFSEWPALDTTAQHPQFTICVMRDDVMNIALMSLSGKAIANKKVNVLPLQSDKADLTGCRILYLSKTLDHAFDLNDLSHKGILTIGDKSDFLASGGGISIARTQNKLGFSISQTTMAQAHITPSSKILRLAKEVR